jgi:hypothetical protein
MSDTPRTQNAFAIANLHTTKRMKSIYDEMAKLESELYDARKKATTAWSDNLILDSKNRQLERELAEARKQRDTLAEALLPFSKMMGGHMFLNFNYIIKAEQAIATVKGGSHE